MSAYVVDDRTINTILSHLSCDDRTLATAAFGPAGRGQRWDIIGNDPQMGAALRDLNVRAVLALYPDCSIEAGDLPGPVPFLPYAYKPLLVGAMQAYKALRCLLYQCCEGDVPDAPLYKALDELSNDWARAIICKLPAYDQARWG